jgi:hypothetical protein
VNCPPFPISLSFWVELVGARNSIEPNFEDPDWRIPILEWMVEGKLPTDSTEARRITRRAKFFRLIDGDLYQ